MEKLLSISIAAYNVEKTIEQCLDSFLTSRYLDALELLVINDGSHDRTVEIVEGYEKKYPGIIRLINKENGGHGSTINTSLRLAAGKFYKVLDGDDWIDAAELDKLIECLQTTKAELIVNDYMEVYPDHTCRKSHRDLYKAHTVYSFDQIVPNGCFRENIFAMHESTILTQRLRDVGMQIQEHCFYADTELLYYVGLAAQTVEFHNSCAYQYRLGSSGQSVSPEGIYKHIEDLLKIESRLIKLYQQDSPKIRSIVRKNYLFAIVNTRYRMLFYYFTSTIQKSDKDNLFVQFLREVKRNYPDIITQCNLPLHYRLITMSPTLLIPWMRAFKRTDIFHMLNEIKQKVIGKE